MAIQWDRLLETCCRRDATDIMLIPGSPPLIRMAEAWRALRAETVHLHDAVSLAAERFGAESDGERDGYAYISFAFGDLGRFRAMAFGYPQRRCCLWSVNVSSSSTLHALRTNCGNAVQVTSILSEAVKAACDAGGIRGGGRRRPAGAANTRFIVYDHEIAGDRA